jgi:Holliday junction resolvasome RuvABC endonuclease subunit
MNIRDRESSIPTSLPLKRYALHGLPDDDTRIVVGIDTGVSHVAFCECNLIRGINGNASYIIDLEMLNYYYFEDDINLLKTKDDKFYFIMEKYWELFSHKNVWNVVFEALPLNSIKNESTLKGVIQAQKTTDLLTLICYTLNHSYSPTPPTSIKYALTGNGHATKEEMQRAAYNLTNQKHPIFLSNDHVADAFGDCFYYFSQICKRDGTKYHCSPPPKYQHMHWLWN